MLKRTITSLAAATVLLMGIGQAFAHDGGQHHQLKDANLGVWFEIPTTDMNRAVQFYNKILNINMTIDQSKGLPMAFFPATPNYGAAGALIRHEMGAPGATGPVVYLNGGDDLQGILDRVEGVGGKVLLKKTQIPEVGYFAIFLDSEGNRLGLFSKN